MTGEVKTVQIRILDKDYGVSCTPAEEAELQASAKMLDERMREIRKTGKIVGTEYCSRPGESQDGTR